MIKAILGWQSPDSTKLLNEASQSILDRAVFDGGAITLSGTALTLSLAAFVAHGIDGMVTTSDVATVLQIPANASGAPLVYHVVCYSRWREFTTPILSISLMTDATYTTHVDREYFLSFGKLTVPNGALIGTACTLDLSTSDLAVSKLGKSPFKGVVANVAALPASTAVSPLRYGDCYVVLGEQIIYMWTATGWRPSGVSSFRSHLSIEESAQRNMLRRQERSGIVGMAPGQLYFDFDLAGADILTIDTPTVANTVGLRAIGLLVHGHYLELPAQTVAMPAAPGGADRYDLIFLEVWREEVLPESITTFPTYVSPATLTAAQVSNINEGVNLAASTGLVAQGSASSRTTEVSLRDPSKFVELRWRVATLENCNRAWLAVYPFSERQTGSPPSGGTYIASGQTPPVPGGDGAYVQGILYPEVADTFEFISTPAAGTHDNVRWMLPLAVVRRTALESVGNYIQKIRVDSDNRRFVFPICPLIQSLRETNAELARKFNSHQRTPLQLSGFYGIDPLEDPIVASGSNTIRVPLGKVRVAGEDIDLVSSTNVVLDSASLAGTLSSHSWRDVVMMRVFRTTFPDGQTAYGSGNRHKISQFISNGQGHPVFNQIDFVVVRTQLPFTTVEKYMVNVMGVVQTEEPGLYVQGLAADEDRVHDMSVPGFYAIPIAVVQRRNTGTWSVTNQNGAVSRPDGKTDVNTVADDEILDCRHRIVESNDELQNILETSMDLLIEGRLNTQFVKHPFAGAEIYGTRHLLVSHIAAGTGGVPVVGTQLLGYSDSQKGIFSGADEYWPVSYRFEFGAALDNNWVTWNPLAVQPEPRVKVPLYGHLLLAGLEPTSLEIRPRFTTSPWRDFVASAPHMESGSDVYNPCLVAISRLNSLSSLDTYASPATLFRMSEPGIIPAVTALASWEVFTDDATSLPQPIVMRKKAFAGLVAADYVEPAGGPSTNEMVASYWVRYPHPLYADSAAVARYSSNRGLGVVPDIGWYGVLDAGGGLTSRVAVGIPMMEVTFVSPGGTTSFTLNQAALLAAVPTFYGADSVEVFVVQNVMIDETSTSPGFTSVSISADRKEVSFVLGSAPAIGLTVRVSMVICPRVGVSPDWLYFVQVNPYNSSLSGFYRLTATSSGTMVAGVANASRLILASDSASENSIYFPLEDFGVISSLGLVESYVNKATAPLTHKVSGSGAGRLSYVLMHRPAGTTDAWNVLATEPNTSIYGVGVTGFSANNLYSGFIDVGFNTTPQPPGVSPAADIEVMIVAVEHNAFDTLYSFDLYYTGTPYGGRVGPGSVASPSLDARVQELKARAHGKVMAVSDVYSTTAGSGLTTYPSVALSSFNDGTLSGTLWSSIHDRAIEYRGGNVTLPSFLHQRGGINFPNEVVRGHHESSLGLTSMRLTPRTRDILARLPFPGSSLLLLGTDASYDYKEMRDSPVGYASISYNKGANVVIRAPKNRSSSDGLKPVKVGSVYRYPPSWDAAFVTAMEDNHWMVTDLSRGVSVAFRNAFIGDVEGVLVSQSWFVPINPAFPEISIIQCAAPTSGFRKTLIPEQHHVEAAAVGTTAGAFSQFFGVLVAPEPKGTYAGRLQLVIGLNALASSLQNAYETTYPVYAHSAGGSFDVFTPIGRPLVLPFTKLT